ncbi:MULTISPECIES: RND family transporter [unclassified Mycolicibacterium]|uniref:MMPL/RND family transporter n=1 Tax=unclassified Mycolicibacterium TaxID=2636767 RepID=UPI0012DF27FC|nr:MULTISPECIES: MMPL family transporter [unclassified Mycolicibacterium]MUL84650.1 MMPL family transporter [Mycolicibacterium sp. CBMA 329]MUL88425.1 MMPL family transporter [Mycolicibacterium sp. CBMA 331]MUM03038.1 MMPL family transporter [Mycolicibacterium sp. CBMA 334]MUM25112.1 MMPL family transporter [Mycolicibacterium sp. CBMA 295]MUM40072.1 MMPL family transporter [Mycolicibacterium sp. CBMA 247]
MSNRQTSDRPPLIARVIYRLSVPIILGWLAIIAVVTFAVPSLEQVGRESSVSLVPKDAPSFKAMQRMGEVFKESDSDSVAMIVLEGEKPLGEEAHRYYDDLVRQLRADTKHVQHVQDYWGDSLTASGVQSADDLSAYVQLNLAGNQGQALANESVETVRGIVAGTPPPSGVKAYVTGPAPLITDMNHAGDTSIMKITLVTLVVICTVLLFVYRSVSTVILLLAMVGIQVQAARGVVAFLGDHQIVGLSTFAVNLLVSLGIAVGTDYGIFFIGRYHEARQAGEDRETAFYTTYRSVAKVVVASGLTIAGAIYCLSFTRLPYFETMGVPSAVGMAVAVAVAVTLVPSVIAVGGRFGLFEPKRKLMVRRWRGVGTAVVRWPLPILAGACAVAFVGLLALPGYQSSYDDRRYVPQDIPANVGYAAAERHFPESRMTPDILMLEADHDMRNPTDFLVLHKLAKQIFAVPGIATVQSITRPEGSPIERTSIPFQISLQSAGLLQIMPFAKDRMNDMEKQADEMQKMITQMQGTYNLMTLIGKITHNTVQLTGETAELTDQLMATVASFDDFYRPIRNYLYWEPHCYDIPLCFAIRSVFDALDGTDKLSLQLHKLLDNLVRVDGLQAQLVTQLPPMIEIMKSMRNMMLTMHSTMSGMIAIMDDTTSNATAMGKIFDASQNDDSFYLPPEVFENKDFQRAMSLFFSPDGKAVRLILTHRGDPGTPEGISRVDAVRTAAEEAIKVTPLENASIHLAGTAATYKDLRDGSRYDLLIAGVAALCLVFGIMLVVTRSLVAALVIVGTVALSLGAAFGLSVLVWQHILGIELHWLVLAMSVIVLLAVGSDYNLLLVSRMKEEVGAGINTGIIRAMGGTGKVVTTAGLVFAFTMLSMVVSDLRIIGQVGSTIGLGLLFDTLVVRAFMTPAIAALLGRWFWWPLRVRQRPSSAVLGPVTMPAGPLVKQEA